MKYPILTFLLELFSILTLPYPVYSQVPTGDISYVVSQPYKVINAIIKYNFHRNDEIMMVKFMGPLVAIQKFNAQTLKFLKVEVYHDMPRGFILENVIELADKYYIFYSLWDRNSGTEQLFFREIDFDTGSLIDSGNLLINVVGKIANVKATYRNGYILKFRSRMYSDPIKKFEFRLAHDKSMVFIKYRRSPEIKNNSKNIDVIGIHVFGANLEESWHREIEMPYTEAVMTNLDYSIDAEGNAYILTTVKEGNDSSDFRMELFKITADKWEVLSVPLEIGIKHIKRIWMYESPKGYMVCAGYYNDGSNKEDADGVINFKVSKDGEVYDMFIYEIPIRILNQFVAEKKQERNMKMEQEGKAEFENLVLRKLALINDGSIILIGEQHVFGKGVINTDPALTYREHDYDDILIVKINAKGMVSWMKRLPKRQAAPQLHGELGFHYEFDYVNGYHYLIFMDKKQNLELNLKKIPVTYGTGPFGFLALYKIKDESGEVTKSVVFDKQDVNGFAVYRFNTVNIFTTAPNEFVVELYKKKKEDVMIKIKVNE